MIVIFSSFNALAKGSKQTANAAFPQVLDNAMRPNKDNNGQTWSASK
jgi:hypothetical protein